MIWSDSATSQNTSNAPRARSSSKLTSTSSTTRAGFGVLAVMLYVGQADRQVQLFSGPAAQLMRLLDRPSSCSTSNVPSSRRRIPVYRSRVMRASSRVTSSSIFGWCSCSKRVIACFIMRFGQDQGAQRSTAEANWLRVLSSSICSRQRLAFPSSFCNRSRWMPNDSAAARYSASRLEISSSSSRSSAATESASTSASSVSKGRCSSVPRMVSICCVAEFRRGLAVGSDGAARRRPRHETRLSEFGMATCQS